MTEHGRSWRSLGIRAMERVRRTDGLGLLPDLNAGQWSSYEQLRAQQVQSLREYLVFCRDRVPYYRDLFSDIGFAPENVESVDALQELPVLDKTAIRNAGDRLYSAGWERLRPRAKSTSGSTGEPLNYHLDFRSHSYLWAHIWRAWGVTGYRPGDLYATLSGGALLPEKVDLKQRVYLLLSGCLHMPCYHLTEEIMARYAATLARRRVHFLYGYPSSLELFAAYLLSSGSTTLDMSAVFTTSELLSPEARATIEQGLGCPVFDLYGCNDGGLYSFECEQHAGLHQAMESCIVEVVDEAGRTVPPGETGEIVTTHIANRCHPFLRYRTGDMGALDPSPCACGRGLVRIVDIQGRERDFVLTPDGRKVHGAFFNHFEPFYAAEWLQRYQVHQPTRDEIVVSVVVTREPTAAETEEIVGKLREGLGPMQITIRPVASLELTRAGKFRVVTSAVA